MVERPLKQIAEEILADWKTIEKTGADECAGHAAAEQPGGNVLRRHRR